MFSSGIETIVVKKTKNRLATLNLLLAANSQIKKLFKNS